ncbi:MAG: MBL fold metallo-hydrolase, partial [Anaerolineae bacterium]|nr:MBL fold metallo-hydrolase [Anaerolineae bacterium]
YRAISSLKNRKKTHEVDGFYAPDCITMSLHVHIIKTWMSNAFLIESSRGMVLIDAGPPRSERKILEQMQELGRDDLQLIFLTHAHYDHFGSVAAIKHQTGAPVAINRIDADALARAETALGTVQGSGRFTKMGLPLLEVLMPVPPMQADLLLDHGDRLDAYGLDAQIIHTPGHTLGSSTLLVENRLAFVGDLVSMMGEPHAQNRFAVDWRQLAKSLHRLQQLQPEWVYSGHGPQPLSGEAFQQLRCQY